MHVEIKVVDVGNVFAGLDKRTMAVGISRALNKVASSARVAASREIRQRYTIKAAAVNRTFKIIRARPTVLRAELWSEGGLTNIISLLGTRQTAKGVTFKVKRDGDRKLIPGAFVLDGRIKGAYRRSGKVRLPIEAKKAASVPQLVASKKTQRVVEADADSNLDRVVAHEVAFAIEQKAALMRRAGLKRVEDIVLRKIFGL